MTGPGTANIDEQPRICFIGGGNMARSLIGGLVHAGVAVARIDVAEPNADLRTALAHDFGVGVHVRGADAARDADAVVLAIKPQVMKAVCAELRDVAQRRKPVIVSIAAGMRLDQIDAWLGGGMTIVRCMPNTPALIGAGASGLCANARTDAAQRKMAQSILDAAGVSVWIDDEALMDTVTALSGSGPAYFFVLVEALEDAAVAQGLPRAAARTLATQTCLGAGRMLCEDGAAPGVLRERVTSPNGTTQAALESFAANRLREVVAAAVAAATKRGVELSAQLD
ncbi:MAG TPA: pyrroline-5-carboxylate reductase [Rudaea sp.]|jgi:pyrroline-5-carboxylate reductase|uniref:pyrroline-5-carboxylate reductase n=1 Tax=Rudaea sp. TaxID=2136325 RepID=UPI002F95200E